MAAFNLLVWDAAGNKSTVVKSATTSVDFQAVRIGTDNLQISEDTGKFSFGAKELSGVADPTTAQSAATKNYVDTAIADIPSVDLSDYFKKDGTVAATGDFDLGGHAIANTSGVSSEGDLSLNTTAGALLASIVGNISFASTTAFGVTAPIVALGGSTSITIDAPLISFNTRVVSNLGDPLLAQDAATKNYVDTSIAAIPGVDLTDYFKKDGSVLATGSFDMDGSNVNNVTTLSSVAGNDITIVGGVAASGDDKSSGGIVLLTDDAVGAGNTGNINLTTGAIDSGGTRGLISMSAGRVQIATSAGDIQFNPSGRIDFTNHALINVSDPSNPSDAATKAYVDAHASGNGGILVVPAAGDTTTLTADQKFVVVTGDGTLGQTIQLPAITDYAVGDKIYITSQINDFNNDNIVNILGAGADSYAINNFVTQVLTVNSDTEDDYTKVTFVGFEYLDFVHQDALSINGGNSMQVDLDMNQNSLVSVANISSQNFVSGITVPVQTYVNLGTTTGTYTGSGGATALGKGVSITTGTISHSGAGARAGKTGPILIQTGSGGTSVSSGDILIQTGTGSSGRGMVTLDGSSLHLTATGGVVIAASSGLVLSGGAISDVLDPVNAQDAATKNYVDTAIAAIPLPDLSDYLKTDGTVPMAGNLNMGTNIITNVGAGVSGSDVVIVDQLSAYATTAYVNAVLQGLDPKAGARVATTEPLPTNTYDNGTAGVGATLTASASGAFPTTDGLTLVAGDRIVVKDEVDQTKNGIYNLTTVGDGATAWVLTRSTDADTCQPADNPKVTAGMYLFVFGGTQYGGSSFVLQTNDPITLGTSNLVFEVFQQIMYTAGDGIQINGSVISADFTKNVTNADAGALAAGDICYLGPTGVIKAQATVANLNNYELVIAAATIAISGSGKAVCRRGAIVGGFTGLTVGESVFVAAATAGAITQDTSGFVTGNHVYSIGRAFSATEILFNPEYLVQL